ncbi:MAG: hypothetical protein ACREUN_15395 [Burkholderiales bacterium]
MELTYARWLSWCTRLALATLIASFLAYVLGATDPLVPLERLSALWRLPVDEFRAASGAPAGWDWLARAGRGDYTNMVGVALLCLVTVVCYVRVLLLQGDAVVRVLALAQVLVLLAAASGLLAGGH